MLFIIFSEIAIALVTILGCILVASLYSKSRNIEDLYVALVLAFGALTDMGMIYSQVAFSLGSPRPDIGFKVFLFSIVVCAAIVWLHLCRIYALKLPLVTLLIMALAVFGEINIIFSRTTLAMQSGVIVPGGGGINFVLGMSSIALLVGLLSLFAIWGLKRFEGEKAKRFLISRTAGLIFFMFLVSLFAYLITNVMIFYFVMWLFAFFAMLFLALFSMIKEGSEVISHPMSFFRTRIIFKLVITLVLMVILSLEGMGMISLAVARQALSDTITEGYRNIASDTVAAIDRTYRQRGSEQRTLEKVSGILESTKIGTRGTVFLISPDGAIFINRQNRWVSLGNASDLKFAADFMKKQEGEIDIFGEKVIGVYAKVPSIGWSIIVGQPVEFAYKRLTKMEANFIIFMLAWISVTVVIGVLLSRNIEDPVRALEKGITKISQGDLDYKIHTDKIDELGQLATAINRMTEELKDSQASLLRSERLASLGYMAAGLAHEIKNALVPLKTLTELLAVSGKDESFIAKFNELVPREIDRINSLSSDLVHYSRPSSAQFAPVNLNAVAEEVSRFLEMQARKKNVKIVRDLKASRPVMGDRQKLIEAFTNIVLNAIEAMDEGEIKISLFDSDNGVTATVADNGPGIPPENLKKIFVPFFTTKKEGTGMGLAITQKTMADHGGSIDIMSEVGKGTTFYLSFPRRA